MDLNIKLSLTFLLFLLVSGGQKNYWSNVVFFLSLVGLVASALCKIWL